MPARMGTTADRIMRMIIMKSTNQETKPAKRRKIFLPFPGIAILAICLLAGGVLAADTESGVHGQDGSCPGPGGTCPVTFGVTPCQTPAVRNGIDGALSGDQGECTSHTVECFDSHGNSLGKAGSGCYWVFWQCTDDFDHMMANCKEKYGRNVFDVKPVTNCYFECPAGNMSRQQDTE